MAVLLTVVPVLAAEGPACPAKLDSVVEFDTLWVQAGEKGMASTLSWLDQSLAKRGQEGARGYRRMLYRTIRAALEKRIEKATLPVDKKDKLRAALKRAIDDLVPPGDEGGGGGHGGGGGDYSPTPPPDPNDPLVREVERRLKNEIGFRQCTIETTILLTVSSLIAATGTVIVNWDKYSRRHGVSALDFVSLFSWGDFLSAWGELFSTGPWKKASQDGDFRQMMLWNAALMTSVGITNCLSSRKAGRDLITAISLAASVGGQYVGNGKVSVRQTMVDVLWVRYITFWKTGLALRYARGYAEAGKPYAGAVEVLLQGLSEITGALGYPLTNKATKWIWAQAEERLVTGGELLHARLARPESRLRIAP